MKKLVVLLWIFISLCSCKEKVDQPEENKSEKVLSSNENLAKLFEEYHEGVLKMDPISATRSGDTRYNDRFVNVLNDSTKEQMKLFYSSNLEKVSHFADEDLNENDLLSKRILEWECTQNSKRLNLPDYTPIDQMWSVNLVMGQFASGSSAQPFQTVKDYENWLKTTKEPTSDLFVFINFTIFHHKNYMLHGFYVFSWIVCNGNDIGEFTSFDDSNLIIL